MSPETGYSTLEELISAMRAAGARKFYSKPLAPNDNSKNQVYLGEGFSALNVIPHGSIQTDAGPKGGAVRDRAKANVEFYWISPFGLEPAPNAKLILYPRYPEVRFSGFLRGAKSAPNHLMTSRASGRELIFGVCDDGRVIGYAAAPNSATVRQLTEIVEPTIDVFRRLTRHVLPAEEDTLHILKAALREIHDRGAINGKRLHPPPPGKPRPYSAPNGGGYTLEAELGILPNGDAEPDFMGWEIKSFSVPKPGSMLAKSATTMLTPEPTVGVYAEDFELFMYRYGYEDRRGRVGRRNFGGVHKVGILPHHLTGLTLELRGFNPISGTITDLNGTLALMGQAGDVAAGWRISDLVDHWARKHEQAAFVPVFARNAPRRYQYGSTIKLGVGTDAIKLLTALHDGGMYLDPGVRFEPGIRKPKKRNQFRVRHPYLKNLYRSWRTEDLYSHC